MNERTQTLFPATHPEGLMTVIVNYSEGERDFTFEIGPDGTRVIEMEGARLTFQSGGVGVWVEIAVPEPAMLGDFQGRLIGSVAWFDPAAATGAPWQGEMVKMGKYRQTLRRAKCAKAERFSKEYCVFR